MLNIMKKWWKLHKMFFPMWDRSYTHYIFNRPKAQQQQSTIMIWMNHHKPSHYKYNNQTIAADTYSKIINLTHLLYHALTLTQAYQSAVFPSDGDWGWGVLTRHMRGSSSIKHGLGWVKTGAVYRGEETAEFPPWIILTSRTGSVWPVTHWYQYWHLVSADTHSASRNQ